MLWKERPFPERFLCAADAGFEAVEFLWPRGENLEALVKARERAGLKVALFNVEAGDLAAGERGYMNNPARRNEWRTACGTAIDLARRLDCRRLNCLVGNDLGTLPRAEQLTVVRDNIEWAMWHAEPAQITLSTEALNPFDTPRYLFLRTADPIGLIDSFRGSTLPGAVRRDAIECFATIRNSLLRLQYDVYHMQRAEGNLIATIRAHAAQIGHVQIADSPDRHQPGTGEIAWKRVLGTLEEIGYDGYVGLEYVPLGTTEESLAWLPRELRRGCRASELNL
jgi:hydroxypyruvate isomerase